MAKKDGAVLAVNGILNEAGRAGQLAYQNSPMRKEPETGTSSKPDPIVLVHIQPASTDWGELMVAGYEKLLAPLLGYSNGDLIYANTLEGRDNEETLSLGHSRGTIIQTNAFNILADRGYENNKLTIVGVGGAGSVQTYVDAATRATKTPENTSFTYMRNDPVPVIAAGNAGDAYAAFKEFFNVLTTSNSAHSCYGTGASGCATIATPASGGPVPSDQRSQNVMTYRGGVQIAPQDR